MSTLPIPRPHTWDTLQKSRNIAAIATLTTGLSSHNPQLRHLCLKSLIVRKEEAAKQAVILHWECFDEQDLEILRADARQFVDIAKRLLTQGNLSEKRAALTAIATLDLSDSIDVVLDIVVNPRHALCQQATTCLVDMCQRWGKLARNGKDVPSIRTQMLEKLHKQLVLFPVHKNMHIVDSWLCLAHWEDALQRGIITDSKQEVYRTIMGRLRCSDRPEVLQLVGGYLWRAATPSNVMEILAERPEPELALEIAKSLDSYSLPIALKRLRKLPPLECLKNLDIDEVKVGFEQQKTLWLLTAASLDDLPRVLHGAIRLSKLGTADARQTAAEMLRRARKQDIEVLVPAIQASTVEVGTALNLGDLIKEVAAWLHSPSLVLKKAAQDFLKDFSLDNLLEQARHWPVQMSKAMASIVALTETNVEETLSRELQSPAPKRRLAALQITEMLGCAEAVSQWLMPLLDDPRLDVRVRVIDLLSALGHESLESLLPELLRDASTDIQDAANRAVRRQKRRQRKLAASDQQPVTEEAAQ